MPSARACTSRRWQCCIMAAACAWAVSGGFPEGGPEIEIEFAPMDMAMADGGPDPFMDLLSAAAAEDATKSGGPRAQPPLPPFFGPQPKRGKAKTGREAELDNMLDGILGGLLDIPQTRRAHGGSVSSGLPGGMPGGVPGFTEEVVISGPTGTQVMTSGSASSKRNPSRSSMPGGLIRDLFPAAMLAPGPMVIDGSGPGFGFGPDPLMMDIMQDLDRSFSQDMLPAIQKATSGERDPSSCREDIKKFCVGATSHLHCLGINHDSISEACRKDVGQAVPYRCSKAIDKFCDVLQTGILTCLYNHMDSLDGQCRDSVLTTKHVINKVNTQQVSVVDPSTGIKKVSKPAAPAVAATKPSNAPPTPVEKEATLDAKLGLAPPVAPPAPPVVLRNLDMAPPVSPVVAGAALASIESEHEHAGWFRHFNGFSGFLIVALVAFGAYLIAFTDYTNSVRARLRGFHTFGDPGGNNKLLNAGIGGMELPRPDAM